MNNNEIYKNIILEVAKEKFPHVRKRTYSLNYYLNMFCLLDNDIVKWKSLEITKQYKPKNENKNKGYHYGTIKNFFNEWCKKNIFVEAHNRFIKKYYYKLKPHLKKLGINLYIDTTSIWNKYGIEGVAVHPEYRKKNVTKIGTLVDSDGDIVSIVSMIVNSSIENINQYEFVKKTFNHDVTVIQELFDNIVVNLDGRKNIILCGDKAFKTNNEITHKNKTVEIITPKRMRSDKQAKKMIKNLKNKVKNIDEILKELDINNEKKYLSYICKKIAIEEKIEELRINKKPTYTEKETSVLNNRHIVENNYNLLKKSDRINIRKDHNIKNFMAFIYISELKRLTKKYSSEITELNLTDF